jgi:gliding motility-associated-like protein
LIAGPYNYTITDNNGCSTPLSVTITEPTPLVGQATPTVITANGGTSTVTVTASGGTAPYSGTGNYTVSAGTYSYVVTDANGCQDSVSITVTEPDVFTANSTVATTISCYGGTGVINVVGEGGTPPYSGDGNFTVTQGTYTYIITDFYGNVASTTVSINEPSPLIASSSATQIICNGDSSVVSVTATGGTSPYSGTGQFNELAGTHTYLVTDNNGCQDTTTISITQPTAITLTTTVQNILCPNGTGWIDLTVTGGVSSYNVVWNGTINSEDLTSVYAGSYIAQVTDANGCSSTITDSVIETLSAAPVINNITGNDTITCTNPGISVSVSNGNGFTWSGGSSPNSSSNTFTTPGTYTLNTFDGNGCPRQLTITIYQNITPPSASISTTGNMTELNCLHPTIGLQASGNGTYQWSGGLGNGQTAQVSTAGNVLLTVTGSNGCTNTASVNITSNFVYPTAVITNVSNEDTLDCNTTAINLLASGGNTYSWNNNMGNNAPVTITSAGTYTVTVTAANGCQDNETVVIYYRPNPTLTVAPVTICSGQTATLVATPSITGGTFSWNSGAPTASGTFTASPSSNAIYSVIYTYAGCSSPLTYGTVTVVQTPSVTLNGPDSICSGQSATLLAVPSLPSASGIFTWTPSAPSASTNNVSPGTTTVYQVTYTLNGCTSSSASRQVFVKPTPTVTVQNANICAGQQGTLTAVPSLSGGSYNWQPGSYITQSITESPAVTSTYTVSYTLNGCTSPAATGNIIVTPIPSVQVSDIGICEGQTGILTAIPSVNGGTYTWNPGGLGGETLNVSPTSSQYYTVVYSVNNCSSPVDSALVTVTYTPVVTVNNASVCQGDTAILTAVPSVSGGSYNWNPGGFTTSTVNVAPLTNTNYQVVYSLNGCPSAPATAVVTVNPIPTVTFDVDYTEGCFPLTVNLTNTTQESSFCTWNLGNGTTVNECGTLSFTYQQVGCFDISLTTDSPNGCTNTLTVQDMICVHPSPIADFILIPNYYDLTDPTVNFDNNSSGAVSYVWDFGDSQTDSSANNPGSYTYTGDIEDAYFISLFATSEYGCVDSIIKEVHLNKELNIYAPNTFIPDNDGLNDVWMPVISSGVLTETYQLQIFNRWGEQIFETRNVSDGWDGTFNGVDVQDGTYTYRIYFRRADNKFNEILTGHINLLK